MSLAKIFSHGGSQAVRLPKQFRLPGSQVHVRRVGADVVLSPLPATDAGALLDALAAFEDGTSLQREQPSEQQRAAVKPVR